jgi:release factor glutamine methyltransferase
MSARGSFHGAGADSTGGAALERASRVLAAVSESPRLDSELLLAFATGRTRSSLLAFPERVLDPAASDKFAALLARRARGEPLAHLTGEREFYSLPLAVSADVLVPRPETELLVDLVLTAIKRTASPAVLDVGTGSGAIALAVKHARRDADVIGSDTSPAALSIARANAIRLALDVQLVESSWFAAFAGRHFDVIVSNPPYLRSADVRGALEFEPRLALDGGADGLRAYRTLLAAAPDHLAPHGILLLEHGHEQRTDLAALAAAAGWRVAAAHDDLAGRARVLALERGAQ